jgi:hypothetical protein
MAFGEQEMTRFGFTSRNFEIQQDAIHQSLEKVAP